MTILVKQRFPKFKSLPGTNEGVLLQVDNMDELRAVDWMNQDVTAWIIYDYDKNRKGIFAVYGTAPYILCYAIIINGDVDLPDFSGQPHDNILKHFNIRSKRALTPISS